MFWGDPYSVLALSSAFFAISSLVLATIPFAEHIAMGHLFLGLPLSIADALFPFLITKMYHDLCQKIISQRESPVRHEDHHLATVVVLRTQLGSRSFWSAMRQLPLLSTALLVPIVFMSGELRSIQQNCYVLDVSTLWHLLTASGVLNGVVLIFIWLLAIATSPVTTTFLVAAIIAFLLAVITYSRFTVYGWVDLVICWLLSLCFILLQMKEGAISATATTRSIYTVLRNLTVLAVLSACIYNITRLSQETFSFRTVEVSSVATCEPAAYSSPNTSSLNSTEIAEMISATKDNYLGARPHVDTMANLSLIVERCSDAPSGRGVDDVVRCLSYLSNAQLGYFSLPDSSAGTRASDEQSQDSGNVDAFSRYVTLSSAIAASATSIGKCTGPVLPYHVYWTGPASWRVELFIKAYLYTQNLPCSRLWLWLESDLDPNAVNKMLCEDPVFSKFRPLVDRGDIVLKPWNFPLRLPLVKEKTSISNALEAHSGSANETVLPDATVEDATGQQWLVLNPTHTAFSPVQVSDAVRFIVLHLHGGVYLDMDVLILRDMRPLLLPDPTSGHQHAFAEQWVERCNPGEYNTAVISLPANSSLSSYLLRGGVRMGMNFHPKVIGRMMWRDGRNDELKMLHNAVFDPLVTNLRRQGTTTCTVPCHKNFKSAFMSTVEEAPNEWSNYRGETFAAIGDSHNTDIAEALPSTNRTLENFFRGSFAYHIHNQVCSVQGTISLQSIISVNKYHSGGSFQNPRLGWT